MVLMAGVDFPMHAIRQQISRALDLLVQIERSNDGARKVTSITEVQRMEGETVTLQDIFEYKIDKHHAENAGMLGYTGLRPTCSKFLHNGVSLPSWMDEHDFADDGRVPERPVSAFPTRPLADSWRLGR